MVCDPRELLYGSPPPMGGVVEDPQVRVLPLSDSTDELLRGPTFPEFGGSECLAAHYYVVMPGPGYPGI